MIPKSFFKNKLGLIRKYLGLIRKYIVVGILFSFKAAPKPWSVYVLSPSEVNLSIDCPAALSEFTGLKRLGFSYGDWDIHATKLEEDFRYKALVAHFRDNVDWYETDYVDAIKLYPKRKWRRFNTIQDILSSYDQLYTCAKAKPDSVFNKKNPIIVFVDRNGNLAVRDGNHRLVIAKILDVERIYVKILARHGQWLETRLKFIQNSLPKEEIERLANHPDIRQFAG